MDFTRLLKESPLILTECAVSERVRRLPGITLHPTLFNTPLIYDDPGRKALGQVYGSYLEVARDAGLPILLCAPTWRVDRARAKEAGVPESVNRDAVGFMTGLADRTRAGSTVAVGALIGPANDCYRPAEALERRRAAEFHAWQIDELAQAGAEVIVAQTMPALGEALGMADRLAVSGRPYVISFVIDRSGLVLDGTPLAEAIDRMDQEVASPPAGYMVNCVYPTFLHAEKQPPHLFTRLAGIQANASSKDHDQLDGSEQLQQDPLPDWGRNMLRLHREYGVKILGGCCGTDDSYLRYLTDALKRPASTV